MTVRFPRLPDHVARHEGDQPAVDGPELIYCNDGKHWRPATREYFHVNRNLKRGFCSSCIECRRKARGVQPRKRPVSISPGFRRCIRCKRDLPETSFLFRHDSDRRDSYCRTCSNERKSLQRAKRILSDPTFEQMERERNRKYDKKRTKKRHEYRRLLKNRAVYLIGALRQRGDTFHSLSLYVGVNHETLSDWVNNTQRLPNQTTMERVIPLLETRLRKTA